jgi:hypothetical protein
MVFCGRAGWWFSVRKSDLRFSCRILADTLGGCNLGSRRAALPHEQMVAFGIPRDQRGIWIPALRICLVSHKAFMLARKFEQLWNLRGVTRRGAYLGWGIGLMALKYNLDRLIASRFSIPSWTWASYWQPLNTSINHLDSHDLRFVCVMLATALPFIAAGVVLTLRRLRDAHWPLGFVALFFIPVLNLVLFALLVAVPSRVVDPAPSIDTWWSRLARRFAVFGPAASACLAIVLTVVLIVPLAALSTVVFREYGWGVFVALPFCLGLFAALFHSAARPRSWWACAGVALLALLFCGLALVAVAVEGVVCLLMAAPLASPLVLLGATAGYFLQIGRWRQQRNTVRLYAAGWVVLPLALLGESSQSPSPALNAVTSTVEIAASPDVVWRHVVEFSELPPPSELIFRVGIAYPVRARIWGHGVGAVRHCEFSTGPFVEPITVWDEPRLLAFDVTCQPHPMIELSPYRELDTPHLNGFFLSRRGQFLLTPLPGGKTRLAGTTWYTQDLWPGSYWRVWSDYLVHRIHARVLEHIKAETETRRGV